MTEMSTTNYLWQFSIFTKRLTVWIHRKIAGALVGYEPISDRVLVVRLEAKPRNITLIQVYGPTTAATDEEMERFYQDLLQAVKQVPKGDMRLVMGDFNAKVGRRELSAMSSAVGLYGLGETCSRCAQMENKLDELSHISGSRLRHRSSVACGDAESQVG